MKSLTKSPTALILSRSIEADKNLLHRRICNAKELKTQLKADILSQHAGSDACGAERTRILELGVGGAKLPRMALLLKV